MNNIQKTFLSTADKIIPFNPVRANYGFSSVDGKDLDRITALLNEEKDKNLYVRNLPVSDSFVAILLRIPRGDEIDLTGLDQTIEEVKQQSLRVEDVQTAPPGVTNISFTLDPEEQYYLYVLSNRYSDGYIADGDLSGATLISETVDYNERYLFDAQQDAKIFIEGIQLQESNLNGNGAPNNWYDFQDDYSNPYLIWEDPQPWLTYGANRPRGEQSWLIYMRNLYSEMQSAVFRGFDLVGLAGKDKFDSTVYARVRERKEDMTLTDVVRGNFSRELASHTWSKWVEERDRFVGGDDDVREAYYYRAQWGGNDGLVADTQIPGDPTPEFSQKPSRAEARAAAAVFYAFVFRPMIDRGGEPWNLRPPFNSRVGGFFGSGGLRDYDDIAKAVGDEIEDVTELQFETSHPVIGGEANEVFTWLKAAPKRTDDDGRDILQYMFEKLSLYDTLHPEGTSNFWPGSFFHSASPGVIDPDNAETWERRTLDNLLSRRLSHTFLTDYYWDRLSTGLQELDDRIADLGDGVLIPPPEDESDLPELAHEATLQNIRFLRGLLDAFVHDSWTESTNFSSFILKKIEDLRNELLTLTSRANTLFGITDARVNENDIEVLWKRLGDEDWQELPSGVIDQGMGVKAVDVSIIRDPGQYVVLIRPRGLEIRIENIVGEALITTPDLDDYRATNFFFGWNIEFTQPGTTQIPIGEQRMIVGSQFNVGATELLVSPNIFGLQDFSTDVYAYLWPNSFIPVMVDLEVTEHNIQTLAYAEYGQREFNTETGVLTIYDFNDRPFKRFTVGERTRAEENYNNIEFKDPVD